VNFIQRWGSALNPHFHALALDVYPFIIHWLKFIPLLAPAERKKTTRLGALKRLM
jgi:hypothetical protein